MARLHTAIVSAIFAFLLTAPSTLASDSRPADCFVACQGAESEAARECYMREIDRGCGSTFQHPYGWPPMNTDGTVHTGPAKILPLQAAGGDEQRTVEGAEETVTIQRWQSSKEGCIKHCADNRKGATMPACIMNCQRWFQAPESPGSKRGEADGVECKSDWIWETC